MWTISGASLGASVLLWIAAVMVEPSAAGGRAWIGFMAPALVTIAAGFFSIWPVAWRVAEWGPPPTVVLWGASACVWFGVYRLTGTLVDLSSGIVNFPLDGLLLLFGGSGVLERSRGWRICAMAMWALIGLAGFYAVINSVLGAGFAGSPLVKRAGSSVVTNPGLTALIGAALGLVGLALAAILSGPEARAWCSGGARHEAACARCGYDLHGIEGTVCPECGVAFDQDGARNAAR